MLRQARDTRCRCLYHRAVSIELNGIRLRNRVVASASLVGYGALPEHRLIPYGLSPVARFLDGLVSLTGGRAG